MVIITVRFVLYVLALLAAVVAMCVGYGWLWDGNVEQFRGWIALSLVLLTAALTPWPHRRRTQP